MRKITLLLFLSISFSSYAQLDEFLFEINWFLKGGNVDGEVNPVYDEEAEEPFLFVSYDDDQNFLIDYCQRGMEQITGDYDNFTFENGSIDISLDVCENPESATTEQQFFSFFADNINEEFSYVIGRIYFDEDPYEIWDLTITAPNGDYLFFEDYPRALNITTESFTDIKIYPNPASDFITIQTSNLKSLSSYSLMDAKGSVLWIKDASIGNTLPIKELEVGIYFLELLDKEGRKTIERFVKR